MATVVTANNNNSSLVTPSLFCTKKIVLGCKYHYAAYRDVIRVKEIRIPTCRNVL